MMSCRGITALVVVATVALGCGSSGDDPSTDSRTSWLEPCDSDGDCVAGSCVCSVCTLSCGSDPEVCGTIDPDASCAGPSSDEVAELCGEELPEESICVPDDEPHFPVDAGDGLPPADADAETTHDVDADTAHDADADTAPDIDASVDLPDAPDLRLSDPADLRAALVAWILVLDDVEAWAEGGEPGIAVSALDAARQLAAAIYFLDSLASAEHTHVVASTLLQQVAAPEAASIAMLDVGGLTEPLDGRLKSAVVVYQNAARRYALTHFIPDFREPIVVMPLLEPVVEPLADFSPLLAWVPQLHARTQNPSVLALESVFADGGVCGLEARVLPLYADITDAFTELESLAADAALDWDISAAAVERIRASAESLRDRTVAYQRALDLDVGGLTGDEIVEYHADQIALLRSIEQAEPLGWGLAPLHYPARLAARCAFAEQNGGAVLAIEGGLDNPIVSEVVRRDRVTRRSLESLAASEGVFDSIRPYALVESLLNESRWHDAGFIPDLMAGEEPPDNGLEGLATDCLYNTLFTSAFVEDGTPSDLDGDLVDETLRTDSLEPSPALEPVLFDGCDWLDFASFEDSVDGDSAGLTSWY